MPNVMFKRGTHTNLSTLVTNHEIIDGCFYLTTDTERLFVGTQKTQNGDPELVEINKSITVVDSISNLPSSGVQVGQFYYVSGTNLHQAENDNNGNILAVCTAVNSQGQPTWVQVNPDTVDGNDHLSNVTVTKGSYDSSNNVIPYTLTFTIANANNVTSNTITKTFNVAPSDIISKADIDVATSSSGNTATVTTKIKDTSNSNALSTGDSFSIAGGDNVTITESNGTITISTGIGSGSVQMAVDGTSVANQVSASVKVNNSNSGNVLKIAGDTTKDIGITWDSTNSIAKIGHSNSSTATASGEAITLTNASKTFTGVTTTAYDDYGHVTSQTTQSVTLPSYAIKTVNVDSSDKSKLKVSLTDQTGTEFGSVTSGSILYNTITVYDTFGGTASQSTIANQGDLGSFYSKSAIDNMMQGLDALRYKGTVGAQADVNALTNVQVGDTYKVSTANSGIQDSAGNVAKLGDLLIATGTEENGYITAATLTWNLVQGNSETDTTYNMKVAAGSSTNTAKLGILGSTDNNSFSKYVNVTGDGTVVLTPTAGDNSAGTIALSHATSGATAGSYAANTAGAVSAGGNIIVPAITVDDKGHVTSISDVTLSIPGADKLATVATTSSVDGKVKLQNASSVDLGSITFSDGNLTTASVTGSGANATVVYNHAVPTAGTDTTPSASKSLASSTDADRQITAITGISQDSYGHVTALETSTFSFARIKDTLSQSATAGTNSVTINTVLKDASNVNAGNSEIVFTSTGNSITITPTVTANSNSTSVNIDIVWGSF